MFAIIIMLIIIFILVSSVPVLQSIYCNKKSGNIEYTEYVFDKELLDVDLEDLRLENVTNQVVTRKQIKDRGSVRIAQGLVFDGQGFELRKQEEYKINLP